MLWIKYTASCLSFAWKSSKLCLLLRKWTPYHYWPAPPCQDQICQLSHQCCPLLKMLWSCKILLYNCLSDCATCTEFLCLRKIICLAENVYLICILTWVHRDAANKETCKGRLALIDVSASQVQSLLIDIQPHIPKIRTWVVSTATKTGSSFLTLISTCCNINVGTPCLQQDWNTCF